MTNFWIVRAAAIAVVCGAFALNFEAKASGVALESVFDANAASVDVEAISTLLPAASRSCHSSSLCPTSDGRLFVVWYGGSREGAKDVEIYGATVSRDGTVSEPRTILNRETLRRQTGRYIRKLGNCAIYGGGGIYTC